MLIIIQPTELNDKKNYDKKKTKKHKKGSSLKY